MRYNCYANGFQFDSHLADFYLFFFTYFQAYLLPLRVSVRLGLWLGFTFYVYFVSTSTKPTALSLCITVTSQVAYE